MDVRIINAGQRSVIIKGHDFETWTHLVTELPPHEELRLEATGIESKIARLKRQHDRLMQAADILERDQ